MPEAVLCRLQKLRNKPKKLYSLGKDVEGHPLLMVRMLPAAAGSVSVQRRAPSLIG
jgi:hypothetical protein